jgi:SAM-dependent methyltransferase
MLRKDLHEVNRISWNKATEAHNSHKREQAHFLKNGSSTLFAEEIELLGTIQGKRLVHLQCNAGQDTLSLASLGASVTGVDISDTAIDFAHRLSQESGIPANFEQADVYDWFENRSESDDPFDIVFVSYGALIWLSDIKEWAIGVASVLAPKGKLIIMEFHPFAMVFKEDWSLGYPYFAEGNVLHWSDGVGDYVADTPALAPSGYEPGFENFVNPFPVNEFQWTLSEIVTAVIEAGLTLRVLKEYPYANGAKLFEGMEEKAGGRVYPPAKVPSLPLMYGLVAEKDSI